MLDTEAHVGAQEAVEELSLVRRFGASAVVLLAGFCASITTFLLLVAAEIGGAERQFTSWTKERTELLQREIDVHVQVLYGLRALFQSSERVSAREFDRYAATFLARHPNMYSLDWLPRVPGSERASFERSATEELGVPFRIRERARHGAIMVAGERAEYWPIYFTQARDGYARLGLDAHARAASAQAMLRAARDDQPSAAFVDIAMQGAPPDERLFVYLPIIDPTNVGRAVGFVRTSLLIEEMLGSTLHDAVELGIAAKLIDVSDARVLGVTAPPGTPRSAVNGASSLRTEYRLSIGGRPLALRFSATSSYRDRPRLTPAFVVLTTGLLVTAFGALATYQLTNRRLHLQALTKVLLAEVAERRLSEQRLSQSEARYRVLVENSPDAVLIVQDGVVTFVNEPCVRLLRASAREDLIGKTPFDLAHPDYHEMIRSRLRAAANSGAVLPPVEQKLVRTDGSVVDVEVLSMPLQTEHGVILQVTARDITQRKAAEAERQSLEAALRQSQKLEALGTLTGGIAHDFNNILSAIVGNARLLLDDLPETHPSWRSAQEIRAAANRARDLVKRLMAFSRQQESQRAPVAVAPLAVELQQLLRATLPAGVDIVVRAPPDTPAILADATQIHQVLLNLCTNAWQAIEGPMGRIEINVATLDEEEARDESGAPLEGASRYVRIGVHDNGAGMPPDVLEHIFEPFFTTKQPGEGSGLGLAVAHGIVQSHGGAITVKSRVGEGSSFLIYLPACDAAAAPFEATQRVEARGARQHILYLDDEAPLVFLAQRTLERAGFRCTGEQDAARAIERVRAAPASFDLVITDLNMPGMSGLDVARELHAIRSDLPIVITTGYIRAHDVSAARELGVRDVVLKPDTIDQLAALAQEHLGSRA